MIAGLAHASGSADSVLTILFTFVVALGASFMPVRSSVAQLAVIAGLLVALVLVVGQSDSGHVEVFKVALLLATLIMLCGLVLLMRATLDQGALGMRGHGNQRYRAILLETPQFEAALDTELSRAGRHERPLSVVMLEVVGSVPETEGRQRRSAFAAIARAIVERIRIEDSVGHLGGMRFAVIAPETTSSGVAAMAATVAGVVRQRLLVAGFDPDSFDVAVGMGGVPAPRHRPRGPHDGRTRGARGLRGRVRRGPCGTRRGPHRACRRLRLTELPRRRNKVCAGLVFRPRCGKIAPGPWPPTDSQPSTRRSCTSRTSHRTCTSPGVSIFEGEPPTYEELLEHIERRLSLVPRFRQKLRFVPFGQGRPVWVDDPHFNLEYHVRATALPPPGSEEQLKNLASRVFAQQLDRTKPLWEIWLVEGLGPGRARTAATPRSRSRRRGSRCFPRRTTRSWTASPASTSPRCCSTPLPSPRHRPARACRGSHAPSRPRCSCSATR